MKQVDWKNEYEVLIKDMDEPRRFLSEKLNAFLGKISKNIKPEYVEEFNALIDGFRIYFSKEEQMLARVKYPGLDEHKALHRAYIRKMVRLRRKMGDEAEPPVKADFYELAPAYDQHMSESDMEFAPFIRLKKMIEAHSIKR